MKILFLKDKLEVLIEHNSKVKNLDCLETKLDIGNTIIPEWIKHNDIPSDYVDNFCTTSGIDKECLKKENLDEYKK